jgi:outer membrane beta-barrel protein
MTPARHRFVLAALSGVLAAALLAPAPAAAQSKSDAFAGKIPPVSAALFRKAGRWEVGASANLSVNDAFYSKYFLGLKVGYHFTETMSAHAILAGGLVEQAGSAVVCPSGQGCHAASEQQMWQVPGHINSISGLEFAWAPVYGKLDAFSEAVGHFDLSLLAGVDWIRYQEVVGSAYFVDENGNPKASVSTPPTVGTIGGHLGIGTRFFFSQWVAARLEFKDYLYEVSIPNWQEGGSVKKDLQNQLFVELGVTFFFPLHNRPVQ